MRQCKDLIGMGKRLLKLEMDGNVFKYFNQFFSFNFPKELFTKQDTKEIMQTIR